MKIPSKGGHERDMLCPERKDLSHNAGTAKAAKKSYNKRLRKEGRQTLKKH
jgi:hypothetical protein